MRSSDWLTPASTSIGPVAIHLAVEAECTGAGPVAVVGTDPQGSLAVWWNQRAAETPPSTTTTLEKPREAPIALTVRLDPELYLQLKRRGLRTKPRRTNQEMIVEAIKAYLSQGEEPYAMDVRDIPKRSACSIPGISDLQGMANRFNPEGVPTLSGKGRWQKGTVGNLLTQEEK